MINPLRGCFILDAILLYDVIALRLLKYLITYNTTISIDYILVIQCNLTFHLYLLLRTKNLFLLIKNERKIYNYVCFGMHNNHLYFIDNISIVRDIHIH